MYLIEKDILKNSKHNVITPNKISNNSITFIFE